MDPMNCFNSPDLKPIGQVFRQAQALPCEMHSRGMFRAAFVLQKQKPPVGIRAALPWRLDDPEFRKSGSAIVCRHQTGFTNGGPGIGGTKARRCEIRPCLLRAGSRRRTDVETVALGERDRRAGRNLRSETRENGEGGCNERCNRDGGKSLDHDGPLF